MLGVVHAALPLLSLLVTIYVTSFNNYMVSILKCECESMVSPLYCQETGLCSSFGTTASQMAVCHDQG